MIVTERFLVILVQDGHCCDHQRVFLEIHKG